MCTLGGTQEEIELKLYSYTHDAERFQRHLEQEEEVETLTVKWTVYVENTIRVLIECEDATRQQIYI